MATIQSVSPIEIAARSERNWLLGMVAWIILSALVTGVLTVLLYKKTGKYQEAVKADADARISESNAEAKRAGESAGLANERAGVANAEAAKANQRAGELETANLTLRGQVATLETQATDARKDVASLQKAASDAKAAQQRVEIELAKQRERTAIAERELAKVKPRSIPLERWSEFVNSLKPFAGQIVYVDEPAVGDPETNRFAAQVRALLTEAGWKYQVVSQTGQRIVVGLPPGETGTPQGLVVTVPAIPTAPALAFVGVLKQFAQVDLRYAQANQIRLIVGTLPIQ